jgi:hypothetical protein
MSILSFILDKFKKNDSSEEGVMVSVETKIVTDEEDEYDKHLSLLKEATTLKKDGEIDSSLKKIDEAIAIVTTQKAIYKKAYYLQLNSQFDEAWNAMNKYIESINSSLVNNKVNWDNFYSLFLDYVQSHADLIKLLKKEKKIKDVIYYGAISEYLDLLKSLILPLRNNLLLIEKHQLESVSKRLKIKSKKYNLNGFDKAYSGFIKTHSKELEDLFKVSGKSTAGYPEDSLVELTKLISYVVVIGEKCSEASQLD